MVDDLHGDSDSLESCRRTFGFDLVVFLAPVVFHKYRQRHRLIQAVLQIDLSGCNGGFVVFRKKIEEPPLVFRVGLQRRDFLLPSSSRMDCLSKSFDL